MSHRVVWLDRYLISEASDASMFSEEELSSLSVDAACSSENLYLLTKLYGVTCHENIILTFSAVRTPAREQFFEHRSAYIHVERAHKI
jgi:hypothetical protein